MSSHSNEPFDGDFDRTIRDALMSAVDGVDPGADGLDRIRAKIVVRQAARASRWRIAPSRGAAGWRPFQVTGAWLTTMTGSVVERFKPDPNRAGWFGWLRPAAAIATGIFVVTAASWAVAALPAAISPASNSRNYHSHSSRPSTLPGSSTRPGQSGAGGSTGGTGPGGQGVGTSSGGGHASPTCSPSASGSPSATTTPTGTPSTTPTGSPSPTTTPSGTGSPSPTESPTTSPQGTPSSTVSPGQDQSPSSSQSPVAPDTNSASPAATGKALLDDANSTVMDGAGAEGIPTSTATPAPPSPFPTATVTPQPSQPTTPCP